MSLIRAAERERKGEADGCWSGKPRWLGSSCTGGADLSLMVVESCSPEPMVDACRRSAREGWLVGVGRRDD